MNAFLSRDITWRPASRKQKQMRNSVRDLLRGMPLTQCFIHYILGPKLFFVTGLVIFATAVARLVCPDLLG